MSPPVYVPIYPTMLLLFAPFQRREWTDSAISQRTATAQQPGGRGPPRTSCRRVKGMGPIIGWTLLYVKESVNKYIKHGGPLRRGCWSGVWDRSIPQTAYKVTSLFKRYALDYSQTVLRLIACLLREIRLSKCCPAFGSCLPSLSSLYWTGLARSCLFLVDSGAQAGCNRNLLIILCGRQDIHSSI